MNLFRSEEHARNWISYDAEKDHLLKPVTEWARIFSNAIFRNRSRTDYVSWLLSDDGKAAFGALRGDLAP